MEFQQNPEFEVLSAVEKNNMLEAFYHSPYVSSGGIMSTMEFNMESKIDPISQYLSEVNKRNKSQFSKAVMGKFEDIVNLSNHTTIEFKL